MYMLFLNNNIKYFYQQKHKIEDIIHKEPGT